MKKFFLPLLLTVIVLGFLLPVGRQLKPLLPLLLSVLLFFNFYGIRFEKKHFFQKGILVYFLVVLVLLPAIVFTATLHVSSPFRLGIFLAVIAPSAISAPIVVGIIQGNVTLAIANTVIYNLLSPMSYAFLLNVYFHTSDLDISLGGIIIKLLLLVFIPFFLSVILKRIPQLTRVLQGVSSYVNLLFLLVVFTAISSSSQQLHTIPLQELFFVITVIFIIAITLYSLGFVFGGEQMSKKALAVSMGQKNSSLCIWLALSNFDPLTAIPPTVYIIIHHIINSFLIFYFSRKEKSTEGNFC